MSKYNVGDKVKVVRLCGTSNLEIGQVGFITEISYDCNFSALNESTTGYRIGNEICCWEPECNLESVTKKQEYADFDIKGSAACVIAFKEAVEQLGWKYSTFNRFESSKMHLPLHFKITTGNKYIRTGEFSLAIDGGIIFNLPQQFSEALEYAKNALESVKPKYIDWQVGMYAYAEKQHRDDYRESNYIPIFKIAEINGIMENTDSDVYLRPTKGHALGVHQRNCRVATKEEYDAYMKKRTIQWEVGMYVYGMNPDYHFINNVTRITEKTSDTYFKIEQNDGSNPGGISTTSLSKYRIATKEEIQDHLRKEAKRRGYVNGVKYKGQTYSAIATVKDDNSFMYYTEKYGMTDYLTDGGGDSIYANGKWAEILPNEVVCNFGDVKFTIKDGIAKCTYGNVDTEEVAGVIHEIIGETRFCGYKLEQVGNVGIYNYKDSTTLKFGCKTGTLGELKELLRLLKESEK